MAENNIIVNDSEVAVLSIVLKNAEMVHELDGLKFFMFSSTIHQNIFAEMEEMAQSQTPIDPALLIATLEAKGTLNSSGGKKYIEQLAGYDFKKETFVERRTLVIKSYKARSLISYGNMIKADKINVDRVDEQINELKKNLDSLLEVRGGTQTIRLGEVAREVYEEILKRKESPGIAGASWGIGDLDLATGGKCAGDLWVIGGRPGMAKTALILNSILVDAKAGVPSLLFEKEMRTQQVYERLISIETGIPITNIRLGILTPKQIDLIYEALNSMKGLPIYIDTSYRSSDPYYIESTIHRFVNLHQIKVVYLDYIGLLVDRDENQTQEIGRYSRLFKSLSNELGICSILISQLNRGVEMRDNKRPIMSDLRQSGNLEEDADLVVGLYRDEYYNKETNAKHLMEFIILKHRNGPPGVVTLRFDDPTNKITGVQ